MDSFKSDKTKQIRAILLGTLPPIIGLSPYCLHLSYALSKKIDLIFLGFRRFSKNCKSFKRSTKIDEMLYSDYLNKIKITNIIDWYNPFSGIKAGIWLKGDILHIQWWISSLVIVYMPILVTAKIKKIKVVISIHNILPHEHNRGLLVLDRIANKIIYSFADYFIVHNKRNLNELIDIFNINQKKISIITHGVLNLVKVAGITQEEAKKHLDIQMKNKVVLFFGYIRKYKGLDVLIEAFSHLEKEIEDIILLVAGQPVNDDWERYEMLIKKNKLENKIKVEIGFIPEQEIEYYFAASDLVVLPYKYLDTHGGIGALALPFNKPLIVTDVGGLPEYTKDKAAIVKPNNVQDLYKKLSIALKDEKLRLKLAKDSEEICKELNWEKIADETIKVYEKLIR